MKCLVINFKKTAFIFGFIVILALICLATVTGIATTSDNPIRRLPIYCVETDEKKISITFDAAWSAEDTDEIIEILNEHNAKATIFVVGDWIDKNPDAVKKFYENGHEIANHSDTHKLFSKVSREEVVKEIEDCNKKIEAITSEKVKLVRAPSGDYDNKSIEIAENMNMKMIQWSVDSLDWKKLSVDEMYSRVVTKTENGSILLFHNGIENTPDALRKILEKLKNDGYEFVTVSELIYWDNYKIDYSGEQKHLKNTSS
ncbi:MAG: polysaccharide deacetylase family protein [Ruminococcaceae bacterium]|nr:polysaccharide deacetylase family protein [Oscillospiraceae bacterium]